MGTVNVHIYKILIEALMGRSFLQITVIFLRHYKNASPLQKPAISLMKRLWGFAPTLLFLLKEQTIQPVPEYQKGVIPAKAGISHYHYVIFL